MTKAEKIKEGIDHVKSLLTDQGFIDAVNQLYYFSKVAHITKEEAYELTEEHYIEVFGHRKHKNYHSWRINIIQKRKRAEKQQDKRINKEM